MNLGDMNSGECQPLQCKKAMNCIEGVRDPSSTPLEMGELRSTLTDCVPCLNAFDLEVRLRATMSPAISELPSIDFRVRITQTLAAVDQSAQIRQELLRRGRRNHRRCVQGLRGSGA